MKQVDELIRGELAAVKSFDAVLSRIKDESEKIKLSDLRSDHVRAVETLKQYAGPEYRSGADVQSAGPWGTFSSAFAGGASFFGDKAAIRALKVGEEHGLQEYREALEDQDLGSDLKRVIQNELLPKQESHLSVINSYLQ
jgi:rubrerythrin